MVAVRYKTAFQLYPYQRSPDQDLSTPVRHPVVIVGGGPVGMALALDLGLKGIRVVVLDDHEGVGMGSRAICFAKRTLEICDRLGCGQPMVDKGVVWNLGRVFRDTHELYSFNLLPEDGHRRPAFINLQQPHFERFIVERIREVQARGAPIEIRGVNQVIGVEPRGDHVALEIDTPDGPYRAEADWLVACDGARSPVREMLGLGFKGRVFQDNFLIADVRMKADFPTERWFWFDPPFNRGQSVLLHKQPDDIWRIDFQLGWNIDRKAVVEPESVLARVRAMLPDTPVELVWTSVYTFQCCTMERYRHGRVFFAGDAAHQVSPFGARGANSGIQDVDNLAWKLALVLRGQAGEALLDSYDLERRHAAEENILNSTRSTDFITPKTPVSRMFRDAVLDLAERAPFARSLVNTGRLSVPAVLDGSPLNGPDDAALPARTRPGAPAVDAPTERGWLLGLLGDEFRLLCLNTEHPAVTVGGVTAAPVQLSTEGWPHLAERWLGDAPRAVCLIRPDQHVAARWIDPAPGAVAAALARAMGLADAEA
ncbi:MAG: FAD-dependent oxidoreductase [Alphaproteobacteria bacterium]|nr:MAG: FAD-dependent oxidoreductase [Alphaproteobacteria bacterium]